MANQKIRAFQRPFLLFTSGLRMGQQVQIGGDTCILGRDPGAELQLDSPFVSRQHAQIIKEGGYWFVVDLFSKNGVIHNMARIEPGKPIPLFDGDEVQIGSVSVFEFHDPETTVHEAHLQMRSPGLWLDEPNREVHLYDRRLVPPLSQQQYDLLSVLFHGRGDVVSNATIAGALWPEAAGGVEDAAVDNAISRLRTRLAELDPDHDFIETVRGLGRRFVQWGVS